MPATKKSSLKKLGVIAGAGQLPARLLQSCDKKGIEVFVVGFEGHTDPSLCEGREYMMASLGAGGKIIDALKAHEIMDLVLIGSIRRPGMREIKPDMRSAKFLAKVAIKALGDDGLLKLLRSELESEGFTVHGIQDFVEELLAGEGPIGSRKPLKGDWIDIKRGIEVAHALGRYDVGQSVIVQEGIVLGVEAIEGTDSLIRRCGSLRRKGKAAILVKICKPGQDKNLDLPAIGADTIRLCADNDIGGIVIEAGRTLILDPADVAELADKHKVFVYALNETDSQSHAA